MSQRAKGRDARGQSAAVLSLAEGPDVAIALLIVITDADQRPSQWYCPLLELSPPAIRSLSSPSHPPIDRD